MKKKVYIAGPMTGYDRFNFPAFDTAAYTLRKQGLVVFSPADNDRALLEKDSSWLPSEDDHLDDWRTWSTPGAPSLRRMLGDDLHWIAMYADSIYMLKGWERSNGARAEHALAVALGLEITYG